MESEFDIVRWPEILRMTGNPSKKTVRKWIKAGRFPAPVAAWPARAWVWKKSTIEAWKTKIQDDVASLAIEMTAGRSLRSAGRQGIKRLERGRLFESAAASTRTSMSIDASAGSAPRSSKSNEMPAGPIARMNALVSNGWLKTLSPRELALWIVYHQHADIEGNSFPSDETIAALLGHAKTNHISSARKSLKAQKLIEINSESGWGRAYRIKLLIPPPQPTEVRDQPEPERRAVQGKRALHVRPGCHPGTEIVGSSRPAALEYT